MLFNRNFSALFLLSASAVVSLAQISGQENQACNPEFARLLVEQQVSESKTVEETDKRIKILLRSADFLWKFDEPTARKYFAEAFKIASERFKEKGFEENNLLGGGAGFAKTILPDLRFDVIKAVARKDADWAKRLSDQILSEYEKTAKERTDEYDKTREVSDLLGIALDSVKTNPALSQYFFRRVMRYPLDSYWYWSLYSLAGENPTAADALYAELLQNYQNETPRRLLFLSAYPFAAPRIFGIDKFQYGSAPPEMLAPNVKLQRQFLNVFFRRVAAFAQNANEINRSADQYRLPESAYMVSALQEIEPLVVQNFPDLLEGFALARSQASAVLNAEAKRDLEARQKIYQNADASFEERLTALEKADGEGKLTDQRIIGLIFKLKKEEEFQKAQSWIDKISDENARNQTENFFHFRRSETARRDRRFDDAKKYAEKVEEIEHRATLLFALATEQLKDVSEASRVLDTLGTVSKIARQADSSVAKAQVLLGLANAYEKVNHSLALDELGEAVRVINQLENPDIFSTAVYRQIVGKDFGFYSVFNTPGYNLETTFEEIGKKDFELSLANARNLNDKYFRTLAVLAIAKNCIQNAPKTKIKSKS